MRILLLGEFSSLHKFLKDGLIKNEYHDVEYISNGDGWKKIPGAFKHFPIRKGKGISDYIDYYNEYIRWGNLVEEFDVIQFMNAGQFPMPVAFYLIKKMRSKGKCLSLLCAGMDYEQVKIYRKRFFKHHVCDYDKSSLTKFNEKTFQGRLRIFNEKYMANQVDIIIPSLHEYSLGYEGKDMYEIIPFPINLDGLEYRPNIPEGKIVFFHGINQELKKGTPFIREALNLLAERYPNDVEVIINKRMPYEEYIQVMRKTNVILDQCCGNGYGINACLSMAQGKITMAPINPEYPAIHYTSCPIVRIEPDVEQIYSQLEFLLENRKNFEQWGYESRQYVETYHECKMIAQKYVDAWKSTGKI